MPNPVQLPLAGQRGPRRDALANRDRILTAAESLYRERGVQCVSMDAIAAEAGVGKGTLYRRFGDRAALSAAVLDRAERAFQEAILRGPPPLGPGAPPRERLRAFFAGKIEILEDNLEVMLDSEGQPEARFRAGPYNSHHQHVSLLLGELDGELDAPALAHLLLGGVSAAHYRHLVADLGFDRKRVLASIDVLLDGLASSRAARPARARDKAGVTD